jgi:putative DNA primase/helicase
MTALPAEDPDALYAGFNAQAGALTAGAVGGADALAAAIVASGLSEATFKPLAAAIGKATGLDADTIRKKMTKARGTGDAAADSRSSPGTELQCATDPDPSTSPEPVALLLDMIVRVVAARVHCSTATASAVALWSVGTWGLFPPSAPDRGPDMYPRLNLHSPMKRCGKSTLLEVVQNVVRRPLPATDVSDAAFFRSVDRWHPTSIVDEFDRLIQKNPNLIGFYNSGYCRTGYVLRTVEVQTQSGRSFDPVAFSTFGAAAMAGIGSAPPTIADRSIRIGLQRQPHGHARRRIGL